ncbi:unnamed protein product, partial [Ectocarpus sp. 12 AP-2014]
PAPAPFFSPGRGLSWRRARPWRDNARWRPSAVPGGCGRVPATSAGAAITEVARRRESGGYPSHSSHRCHRRYGGGAGAGAGVGGRATVTADIPQFCRIMFFSYLLALGLITIVDVT